MKTICALDNVACLVDQFPQSLGGVLFPFLVMAGAIALSVIIASIWKGN